MNFEKFLELVFSNPENISIEYSNIDGKERLVVNGQELSDFNDSEIIAKVSKFKQNIELLDDCTFTEVIEELSDSIDLNALNEFFDKEHFSEHEADEAESQINLINSLIREKITAKIQALTELLDKF